MLIDLKESLRGYSPIPLSDERFDRSHEWFEGQSTQQPQILEWLRTFATSQIELHSARSTSRGDPFRVLSVGCGSGILDLPLMRALTEQVEASGLEEGIDYTGIDPNPIACDRFRNEFRSAKIPQTELSVVEETVESYQRDQLMELTHVVHSMYYFADPATSLRALAQGVAEHGELIVFQAPKGELNLLADCFWGDHAGAPIWFSDDLRDHLQKTESPFVRSRIDAEVNVTACFDPEDPQGRLTLDFLVQSDCATVPREVRACVLDYLRAISRIEDDQVFAPHPVDVFAIHPSDGS